MRDEDRVEFGSPAAMRKARRTESKLLLSRAEYDSLVTQYPEWSARSFELLTCKWCIGGVRVSGPKQLIEELVALKS